jgi:uncharacterized membrane protein YphA (DoxX/SURF4 family)
MTEQTFGWKRNVATVSAILLGLIFLVSGGWKVLSPFQTGEVLEQAQVPAGLGAVGAAALGTLELFAAILLFLPRFRKLGGLLGSALIIFFICWVGYYYKVLVGHECNCFPIIKRSVGPGFFMGDGVMLLMGLAAYLWSPTVRALRIPAIAFTSLVVLAGVSFAKGEISRGHVQVPSPLMVDGKPQNITSGKVFLFFYDPECTHCIGAARFMSKLKWGDTKIISIPTHDPQFAPDFLGDTHFKAGTSTETARLRKVFTFVDPPFGVALDDGQVKETFSQSQFNEPLPQPELKRLGFVQ